MTDAMPTAPLTLHRVVIVDQDRRVQQSLAALLSLTGRIEVIGGARDVRGALEVIERQVPDVVIVDPRLPNLEAGGALVSRVERTWPSIRIVVAGWSAVPEQPQLLSSACSYVTKNGSPEDFVAAIVDACSAAA